MTLSRRIAVASVMIILGSPLRAQVTDGVARPVAPGDTVRLHGKDIVLFQGILLGRDSGGLSVVNPRMHDTAHVPLEWITRAELQRGSHQRGWGAVGRGAAIGAVIGGVVLGLAIASPPQQEKGAGVAGAGAFAVVATTIGSAVGAITAFTHTETWAAFDPAAVPSSPSGTVR